MSFLSLFDDGDLARVLAVVAHPDDMEYGGAAAVARWTARGVDVGYAIATSGEAGIDSVPPERARPLREGEQREACARVGVTDLRFLGFPDGTVEYSLDLRRAIAREIRRFRPDAVVTGGFRETWPGGVLNQADHVAVGRAVVDAARDAGNRWVFPELAEGGLQPWGGVRTVLAFGSPLAEHAVDVTDGFAAGVASLEAHAEYLAGLGPSAPVPADMLEEMLGTTGRLVGVRHAVAVEVLHL
ncbi:PIG-L family deacetylase [Georgenia sp. EYE_87]|uniref:PIG-L deacetylase family protein n=1 Tax=Georgenia sp. EYE_87 TaxID=2853448 RepID=UPI002002ECEF|nr:PIG-L deacetylase family protein [Georgenia sp. EYE_87]MCK6211266.1 PIG-L family deacetylase [Georgenia sp. EYE_87]